MRRVVVTGIGMITPVGVTALRTWESLISSKSGIVQIPADVFDVSDLSCKVAGLIPVNDNGFCVTSFVDTLDVNKMDKFIHYAIAASAEAVNDAGIGDLSDEKKHDVGVLIGSGIGGLSTIYRNADLLDKRGPRRVSPFFITASLINLASGYVSIKYGYKGPNLSVVTACSTGSHAISESVKLIRSGDAKIMVCGGAEGAVCRLGMAGFAASRALSTHFNDTPEHASRPWDKRRDGFVMGDGAGVLVLEEYEHAMKRGVRIYAEVVGYGLSGDAHHITAPNPNGDGAISAMNMALRNANISVENIGYINAHGTSTPLGDTIEIMAIKNVMREHVKNIAISSTKSAMGHLLGAAGSVEAALSIYSMVHGVIPPTLNLHEPEEVCNGLNLVPFIAQERKISYSMSNSFGFGGTNSCLIFKNSNLL